jgi:histidinol-phosphate aminotransferase
MLMQLTRRVSRRNFLRNSAAGAFAGSTTALQGEFSHILDAIPQSANLPGGIIRLDRNENPYGPPKGAIEAVRASPDLFNRYPHGEDEALTEKIARLHSVKHEQVILGAGCRELLRMAAIAYLSHGERLVLATPSFEVPAEYAKSAGAEVVTVPLNKDFQHDLDAMLALATPATRLIYICNPNNPTGSLTPRKDLEAFLEKLPATAAVLIDEAYHHYVMPSSRYASFLDRPVNDPRVIVLRTFSKIYGLAGMRVGYAVGSRQVALKLSAKRLQWGVSVAAARAAAAALEDPDFVRLSAMRNRDDRQEFYNRENGRMVGSIDSHTNFVLMRVGLPSAQVLEHFKKHNILLGPPVLEMDNYVRVSIGRPEEMQEFWRVWDLLPAHPIAM